MKLSDICCQACRSFLLQLESTDGWSGEFPQRANPQQQASVPLMIPMNSLKVRTNAHFHQLLGNVQFMKRRWCKDTTTESEEVNKASLNNNNMRWTTGEEQRSAVLLPQLFLHRPGAHDVQPHRDTLNLKWLLQSELLWFLGAFWDKPQYRYDATLIFLSNLFKFKQQQQQKQPQLIILNQHGVEHVSPPCCSAERPAW